jgi:hypothetical protein
MSVLPQLEKDLGNAADQRLRRHLPPARSTVRRRVRVGVARLSVALSALVAVVIAIIAVSSLSHHHGASQSAGPTQATSPRAQLLHAIAVLREPQVAAEQDPSLERGLLQEFLTPRLLPHAISILAARSGYPAPDRALLRVVSVPSLRAHVLIAPTTYRPVKGSRRRSEGINLEVVSPGNEGTGTGPRPATVGSVLTHGLSVFFGTGAGSNPGVLLVPDGVARVTFGPARPLSFQTPYRVNPRAVAAATASVYATSAVHHNIAAFSLKIPTIASPKAYSNTPAIAATAPTTWYASDGRVIRRTTTQIDVIINVIGRPRPLPPICKHVPRPRGSICKQR